MSPFNPLYVNIYRFNSSRKKVNRGPFSHQKNCALKHSPNKIRLVSSSFSDRILKALPYLEVLNVFEYQKPIPEFICLLIKHFNKRDPTAINLRATSVCLIVAQQMQSVPPKDSKKIHKKKDTKLANLVYHRIKSIAHFSTMERNCKYSHSSFHCNYLEDVISQRRVCNCLEYLSVGQVFINFHFPGLISILGGQTSICFTMHLFLSTLQKILLCSLVIKPNECYSWVTHWSLP